MPELLPDRPSPTLMERTRPANLFDGRTEWWAVWLRLPEVGRQRQNPDLIDDGYVGADLLEIVEILVRDSFAELNIQSLI